MSNISSREKREILDSMLTEIKTFCHDAIDDGQEYGPLQLIMISMYSMSQLLITDEEEFEHFEMFRPFNGIIEDFHDLIKKNEPPELSLIKNKDKE